MESLWYHFCAMPKQPWKGTKVQVAIAFGPGQSVQGSGWSVAQLRTWLDIVDAKDARGSCKPAKEAGGRFNGAMTT